MTVKIFTRTVGQNFGVEAYAVNLRTGSEEFTTRIYPLGFDGAAYQRATEIAKMRGLAVQS